VTLSRAASSFAIVAACIAVGACGLDTGGSADAVDDASPGDDASGHDAIVSGDGNSNVDGNMPDGMNGNDGGIDATQDASIDATADATPDAGVDSAPDAAPDVGVDSAPDSAPDVGVDSAPDSATCSPTNGCYIVPSGWTLVAFDPTNQTTGCPTGWANAAPTDLVEGPNAGGNACGCAQCNTNTNPDCNSGAIKVFYDNGNMQCGNPGLPSQMNNNPPGQCDTDMYTGSLGGLDLKYVPPPPTGGTCTSAGTLQKQNVTYAGHERECHADNPGSANCTGNQCTPNLAAPYSACIAMTGIQTCPSPYTTKHLVGTDVSYTCGNCGCTVNATCTGTVSFYGDMACGGTAKTIAADNQCHDPMTNNAYRSYKYAGTAQNVACQTGAAATPQNLALVNEETICCAP
jgi:hypothetical protein